MKLLIAALVLVVVATTTTVHGFDKLKLKQLLNRREPNPAPSKAAVPTATVLETIEQRVDNFDPQNLATYQQRYYMNGENFVAGGPLFVFLGGEWAITPWRLSESLMLDMAEEHGGYMFYLEHRYYGRSHPTPDVSDENLRWLSPDQALADAAHFLEFIKRRENFPDTADSPVVLIGGHYSGSLAVWMRQRYPHLVDIVWASSAPLVSHINHMEYKQLAAQVYREHGRESCYTRLEEGFAQTERMVADGQMQEMADIFQICNPLEDQKDINLFFSLTAEVFSLLIQFSETLSIPAICDIIENPSAPTPAHGIAELFVYVLEDECFEFSYDMFLEETLETDWESDPVVYNFRQASYQMCMQLGWFHTSDAEDQPFGTMFPLEVFEAVCHDVFGDMHELLGHNSHRFNIEFGGLTPNVTNVIFTQGSFDPWRTLGVMESLNDMSPAIIIEGASQANDLGPIHDYDSEALVVAKLEIMQIIREWLDAIGPIVDPIPVARKV